MRSGNRSSDIMRNILSFILVVIFLISPAFLVSEPIHAATTSGLTTSVYEEVWPDKSGMTVSFSVKNDSDSDMATWSADFSLSQGGELKDQWWKKSVIVSLSGTTLSATSSEGLKKGEFYFGGCNIVFPKVKPTPTPTVKPTPTAKPTATPTPKPTATPTPKPTATPTPRPKPTATPTPRPKPTATPTPRPKPTATPTPKPNGKATPTPKPTATPTPKPKGDATPTPKPNGEATPTPKPNKTITPTVAPGNDQKDEKDKTKESSGSESTDASGENVAGGILSNDSDSDNDGAAGGGSTSSDTSGTPTPTPVPGSVLGTTKQPGNKQNASLSWLWLLLLIILVGGIAYLVIRKRKGEKTPVFDPALAYASGIWTDKVAPAFGNAQSMLADKVPFLRTGRDSINTSNRTNAITPPAAISVDRYAAAKNMRPPKKDNLPDEAGLLSNPGNAAGLPVAATQDTGALAKAEAMNRCYASAKNLRPPRRDSVPPAIPKSELATATDRYAAAKNLRPPKRADPSGTEMDKGNK